MDRVRKHRVDIATSMAAVLAPEHWVEVMRAEAHKTIWAIAKPEEWQQVKLFTTLTDKLADGFFSAMNNPIPPIMAIEDFAIVRHMQQTDVQKGRSGPNLFSNLLNQFDEMMAEWVANEKHKDMRDDGKTDEEIGSWIGYLLMTPDAKLSAKELAAKQGFMKHIPQWLNQRQTTKRLSDDTVNGWLLAVVAAWKALVIREFPGRLAAALEKKREVLL